jgi:hypothetical protein
MGVAFHGLVYTVPFPAFGYNRDSPGLREKPSHIEEHSWNSGNSENRD